MSRKRRRGVIEKKRRDRINSSLTELKRLVPSAYEKQGSAKLEKAEILQLTVDHLKALHARGKLSNPPFYVCLFCPMPSCGVRCLAHVLLGARNWRSFNRSPMVCEKYDFLSTERDSAATKVSTIRILPR